MHDDEVTAIAVHPTDSYVATGETGKNACVYVWNSNTLQVLYKFTEKIEQGVTCIAFSQTGNKLGVVSLSDYTVSVFDLKIGALISYARGGKNMIAAIEFKSESEFVTVGPKHFRHWQFENKRIKC